MVLPGSTTVPKAIDFSSVLGGGADTIRRMPFTPEERKLYEYHAETLRRLGRIFGKELPDGTRSLHLHLVHEHYYVDAFDEMGEMIGTFRLDQLPQVMRGHFEVLAEKPCPDPDGLRAMLVLKRKPQ